jgi:hypothetical protein
MNQSSICTGDAIMQQAKTIRGRTVAQPCVREHVVMLWLSDSCKKVDAVRQAPQAARQAVTACWLRAERAADSEREASGTSRAGAERARPALLPPAFLLRPATLRRVPEREVLV